MNTIQLRKLPITSKMLIVWGMMWRALVVGLVSVVISLPLGFLVGLGAAMVGLESPILVSLPIGILIGGISYYYFAMWIIGSSLGGYVLVLAKTYVEEK